MIESAGKVVGNVGSCPYSGTGARPGQPPAEWSGGGPGLTALPQRPGEFPGGDRTSLPFPAIVVETPAHLRDLRRGRTVQRGAGALLRGDHATCDQRPDRPRNTAPDVGGDHPRVQRVG